MLVIYYQHSDFIDETRGGGKILGETKEISVTENFIVNGERVGEGRFNSRSGKMLRKIW